VLCSNVFGGLLAKDDAPSDEPELAADAVDDLLASDDAPPSDPRRV